MSILLPAQPKKLSIDMPIAEPLSQKGIRLPPKGWVLSLLLIIYLFTGLIGHDPWKNTDAVSIGVATSLLQEGGWWALHLAEEAFLEPPFYYWAAALLGKAFSWLLPLHDAMRLASGIFALAALYLILLASRHLQGRAQASSAPLLLAGSVGFLFHAHEAQPMLALLFAHTMGYAGVAWRTPSRWAFALTSGAFVIAFLSGGRFGVLSLSPVLLTAFFIRSEGKAKKQFFFPLLVSFSLIALCLCVSDFRSQDSFSLLSQRAFFAPFFIQDPFDNLFHYLEMLPWYGWPALPLAAWSLFAHRRIWKEKALLFPLSALLLTLLFLAFFLEASSASALLLLPPLVLLAVPGVPLLRRGAESAFNWFAMSTFTLAALFVWFGFFTLMLGWPTRLSLQIAKLYPGFVASFHPISFLSALLLTLMWFWMMATTPRAPMRSLMHWMSGVTLFWALLSFLWMPIIDYGKSYRSVSHSLAAFLPKSTRCIVSTHLSPALLASFYYFDGIKIQKIAQTPEAEKTDCGFLLIHGEVQNPNDFRVLGWREVWVGHRPSDRKEREKLRLFQKRGRGGLLPEAVVEEPEEQRR